MEVRERCHLYVRIIKEFLLDIVQRRKDWKMKIHSSYFPHVKQESAKTGPRKESGRVTLSMNKEWLEGRLWIFREACLNPTNHSGWSCQALETYSWQGGWTKDTGTTSAKSQLCNYCCQKRVGPVKLTFGHFQIKETIQPNGEMMKRV